MSEGSIQTNFILTGNYKKVMLKLAIPAVLSMFLTAVNTFIDAIYIGQFIGEQAVAGVSLALPLTQIALAIGSLIGAGSSAIASIAIGAKNISDQKKIWGNIVNLNIVFGFIVTLLCFIFSKNLIQLIGGKGDLLKYGHEYFSVYTLGTIFISFGASLLALIRSEGRIKQALYFILANISINIALTPILMHYLELGVRAAAISTIIANIAMCIIIVLYYAKGKSTLNIDMKSYKFDKIIIKKTLSIGMASFLLVFMNIVQMFFLFSVISSYNVEREVAIYGATGRIMLLLLTPVFGMSRALQPVVGINYGAKQFVRLEKHIKTFNVIGTISILLFSLIITLFVNDILGFILPNYEFSKTELINVSVLIISTIFTPLAFNSLTFLQSIGNGKTAGMLTMARQIIFFIPGVLIASKIWGITGIYFSLASFDLLLFFICLLILNRVFKSIKTMN